jgi:glycosyltransferase involved in cell wall biosynthesis
MKICILSSFEDSMQKDAGYSVRTFNIAKGLAESGNIVNVVLPKDRFTHKFVDGVTVYGFKGLIPRAMLEVLSKIMGISRPTSIYFYDFMFAFRIGRLIRGMDVVQLEQQASGGLLIPFIRKVLKRPVVLDCHDVFQALRLQQTGTLRRVLETFLEKLAYNSADLILTVSENEKKRLVSAGFGKCRIEVVPNGVDTKLFTVSGEQAEVRRKYGLEGFRTVIFVGNLEYWPNQEAAQALSSLIAPRVLNGVKSSKFVVVGKSREKMKLPGLVFTGFVSDLSEILNASDVAVAPLFHGSGTRLKILEYFSCGLPVVSTSIGAEGLNVKDGVDIFIEDDVQNFALRIVELLKNPNLASGMGKAGRMLVTSTYDWKYITRHLELLLSSLLSGANA